MKASNITYMDFLFETYKKNFRIKRYSSIDFETIHRYIDNVDKTWFDYIKLDVDQTLESALYAYYNSEDYFDVILIINYKEMLNDMPYSNDKIINDVDNSIEEYTIKLYNQGVKLNTDTINPEISVKNRVTDTEKYRRLGPYQRIKKALDYKYNKLNELNLFIKVPKHQYIHKILNGIREIITAKQEVLELQDLEQN